MTTIDYSILAVLLLTAGVHIYFSTIYREHFVADKTAMNRSYWEMIITFKRAHPVPGMVLLLTVFLQIMLVIILTVRRLF